MSPIPVMEKKLMQPTRKTILVAGEIKPYRGLSADGREIFLPNSKLVMFPVVRYGGSALEPLPRFAPKEIRQFSARVPDLRADHPDAVRKAFERRREHYSPPTYARYAARFPLAASKVSKGGFRTAKKRILAESLSDFTKSDKARGEVWRLHGTEEDARRVGYESRTRPALLEQWIRQQRHPATPAWEEVYKLKYVAIYADPAKTRIYLSDVIEEPLPTPDGPGELTRRVQILEKKQTRRMTRQTSQGGASTFAFKDHPEAYQFFRKKLKVLHARYGNAAKAIREAQSLLLVKYPGAPRVSANTCRNILQGKTGQIMQKNSKRV